MSWTIDGRGGFCGGGLLRKTLYSCVFILEDFENSEKVHEFEDLQNLGFHLQKLETATLLSDRSMAAYKKSNPRTIDVWDAIHVDQELLNSHAQYVLYLFAQEETVSRGHKLAIEFQNANVTENFQCKFQDVQSSSTSVS